jgi:hypothetical protein
MHELFRAPDVFREGAENCARGGRAPVSISESGLNPFFCSLHEYLFFLENSELFTGQGFFLAHKLKS